MLTFSLWVSFVLRFSALVLDIGYCSFHVTSVDWCPLSVVRCPFSVVHFPLSLCWLFPALFSIRPHYCESVIPMILLLILVLMSFYHRLAIVVIGCGLLFVNISSTNKLFKFRILTTNCQGITNALTPCILPASSHPRLPFDVINVPA